MTTEELNELLCRKLAFLDRLGKLLERERSVIGKKRVGELSALAGKKKRVMAAVDLLDGRLREGAGAEGDGTTASLQAELASRLASLRETAQSNGTLLEDGMKELLGHLQGARDTKKVRRAYAPSNTPRSVFIDSSH